MLTAMKLRPAILLLPLCCLAACASHSSAPFEGSDNWVMNGLYCGNVRGFRPERFMLSNGWLIFDCGFEPK